MRILLTVAAALSISTFASTSAVALGTGSARSERPFGIYAGALSPPYPSLWSLSLGFNVTELLQLDLNYGNFTYQSVNVSTSGWGLKFLVPGWSLSPYLSLNASIAATTGTIVISGQSIPINGNLAVVSSGFGLEWLARNGIVLGVGSQTPVGIPFAGLNFFGAFVGYYF